MKQGQGMKKEGGIWVSEEETGKEKEGGSDEKKNGERGKEGQGGGERAVEETAEGESFVLEN
ncbi:hypothetical protein E2C01_012030 [Portunus trituberculatus]|uniref:Uncharacterized protein n=1 Tax=Portunus trituberculatus TaxID=210409 RepID=A0A5B7DCE9_PORTR|nr:hypothetical protein [Portunus trituberculatus]